ncbi:MAG TPA: hypothetical protein VHV56_10170, partial [Pseudolabrys sp.]|nr:hypothetical protein [Pseudolabrys sp.]
MDSTLDSTLDSIMDSIRAAHVTIKNLLDWLPDPVVAVILLALAAIIAYALHKSVRKALRALLAERYP